MSAAYFYHLTERPLVDTLRMLVERSLANGWRVAVRGTDPGQLAALDEALWLAPKDSFLPHGLAGGTHDAQQPVLLGVATDFANDPNCLISVGGAEVTAEEVAQMGRVCILFDGHDHAAVAHARTQWKALTAKGAGAKYWSEEGGRWEMKAES